MESISVEEPPVLTGKSVISSVIGPFDINGNRFLLDKQVHNLPRVPKAERERVNSAVAALMILRCPRGQYGRNSVFDQPDEFYVQPESNRIRIFAYNWGQPISDQDLLLLRSLVPRADSVFVAAMPLYSSPSERVTTMIVDLLTDQEVTRRAAEAEPLISSLSSAAAAPPAPAPAAEDASQRFPLLRPSDEDEESGGGGGRKRRWTFGLF
jgi:hypothetical protein